MSLRLAAETKTVFASEALQAITKPLNCNKACGSSQRRVRWRGAGLATYTGSFRTEGLVGERAQTGFMAFEGRRSTCMNNHSINEDLVRQIYSAA